MKDMRADMGGAATVVSSALAIAKLQLPCVDYSWEVMNSWSSCRYSVNLVVTCPLTENMPGPSATKPGDVSVTFFRIFLLQTFKYTSSVYAMNGKSVEVDNTDAEGRLVLSDAIYYTATEYKPHTLIDVATLTGWRSLSHQPALMGLANPRL